MSTNGSAEGARVVVPEPLTEAAWSPFGWLPVADTDPRDGEHRMTFEWDDAHVNLIGHARAEVPETARRPALRDALPPRHPHPDPDVARRAGGDRRGAGGGGVQRRGATPSRSESSGSSRSSRWCCTGARGTGARSRSMRPRCGSSTCRDSATPRTTAAWTWRPRASRSRWSSRDGGRPEAGAVRGA